MADADDIPLPRGWTKTVRTSVLHAISVASAALTRAWSSAATCRRPTLRLQAELDRARTEVALLSEELAIKNHRLGRVPPRRRPHYRPTDRMRILQLRSARGWSLHQTAEVFAVTEDTIATWLRRTDEDGDRALVQTAEPVNRFPDFVGYLVRRLKALCPAMGKKRIAQVLARAGLQLGATTVRRMLRQQPEPSDQADEALTIEDPISIRTTKAKRPNHIWHVDLTVVPTTAGFWVPWVPFSKLQCWPFCWWVAVVIDQFSRRVIGFALFTKAPTSTDVCGFLDRVTKSAGAKPKHIVTDKGRQFFCTTFKAWCRRRGLRPRFGAVGKHASIAIAERFIRSIKTECTRQVLVPLRLDTMRDELGCYVTWYNEHRPHQALGGRTPTNVYCGSATESPPIETRARWPVEGQTRRAEHIRLLVKFVEGRRHLPVVELQRAA